MMPSLSPGTRASNTPPTNFAQVLPGSPRESLQSFATFTFRFKRYVVYISGRQLNILSSANVLVQAIHFKQELVAITAEDQTGKLVVSEEKDVWSLQPLTEGWTKIWWEKALLLRREDAGDETHWLSWGNDGELLVGGSRALSLFSTLPSSRSNSPAIPAVDGDAAEERRALWSQPVASATRQAAFSPTATLIASCARYDRLVKIWRRLSFEEGLFDHTYLPHPGTVTHIQWRPLEENLEQRRGSGVSSRHDEESEVLYTIANDGVLRIWRASGTSDAEILALHATVDLVAAIPQSPSLTIKAQSQPAKAPRFVTILPADKFRAAINAVIGITQTEKVDHSKELLKEMISKEPDVVVAFDGQGRMSAWGLQSVGHKRRVDDPAASHPYHIAHAEGLQLRTPNGAPALCESWFQDDQIHFLVNSFADGGEIVWWQGKVENFFSTAAGPETERLSPSAAFSGHTDPVMEVNSVDGSMVSRSANDLTQWRIGRSKLLKSRRSFGLTPNVLAATLLSDGEFLLTVESSEINLWDQSGSRLSKAATNISDDAGRFHIVSSDNKKISGLFAQSNAKVVLRWAVTLPSSGSSEPAAQVAVSTIALTTQDDYEETLFAIPMAMPYEPCQSSVVSVDKNGIVNCLLVPDGSVEDEDIEPFATFHTGTPNPAIFAANGEFATLVSSDRKELVIVDLTDGYIEHRAQSDHPIKLLECFTPKARHNFIAVGYNLKVDILAQGRYEHHSSDVPTWLPVRSVSMHTLGLDLTAISWLSNGSLCLASHNAIFVTAADVEYNHIDEETREVVDFGLEDHATFHLPTITQVLKDPLPTWHPSLLSHILRHGHPGLAVGILKQLARRLKFWSSGEDLHPTLSQSPQEMLDGMISQDDWLDDNTANDLREQLEEKDLPLISQAEQQRLKHVVEALVYLRDHVKGLDSNALRYLLNWRLQLIFADDKQQLPNGSGRANGADHSSAFVPEMHWREICFAYHSTSQQALLDILIAHHDNKLTWTIVRKLGIMTWLSEREALEQVFEQAGQTAYRAASPPDPVNAAIYYLALHRKPTLLGLWRIATWHKEQKSTMNFLKRDFSQSEARTAAKKNAYALMGKRRFHYAAAFFLLADEPGSATSLLAGQCEDPAFAIAVARLYCGDGSAELRKLLDDRIIPAAKQDGNRWSLSWCHSVLLEKRDAAEVLVQPQQGVKTWQQDDPTTLLLYKNLRSTPSEHEYTAVLRGARILRRMGLWLLALELVSQWKFKPAEPTKPTSTTNGLANGAHGEPKSMLDDFTSLPSRPKEPASLLDHFAAPEPVKPAPADDKAAREAKAVELLAKLKAKKDGVPAAAPAVSEKKPTPTQFKEPDPNSLLDSFGF